MAVVCGKCRLKNPDSAVLCDCGAVLRRNVDQVTLAAARLANHQVRRSMAKPIGIGVAVMFAIIVLRLLVRMSS